MAHIGVNAHLLAGQAGYRQAGIHYYIRELLRAIPAGSPHQLTLYGGPHLPNILPDTHHTLRPSAWSTDNRLARIAWEQTAWPLAARRDGIDLLHSMAFVTPFLPAPPAVVTIYDLSFEKYPERFPSTQRRYLQTMTRRAARHAQRLIAISESGKRDIHALYDVPLQRIDVVYPGVASRFKPLPDAEVDAFRQRHNLPERFILHVGTLQPRKNLPTLINALAQMPHTNVPLVCVGGKGWLFDEIFARVAALGLRERVIFTGYVDDAELPLWYNAATVLAFPSLYEGFGMPIVEALACGTPVVAANVSAMPEAAGTVADLFDPRDADALATLLAQQLDQPADRDTMRALGAAQAARFDWSASAQALLRSYSAALEMS